MKNPALNKGALYHPVSIGPLSVPGNLFLAPIAGFTDAAFRSVCLAGGAVLAFTEMVSCEGIARHNRKTLDLLTPAEGERFPSVQLFCAMPETAAAAVEEVLQASPALIDLNCGCPVPKVIKSGAGAALMKKPETIRRILGAMRNTLDRKGYSHVPVTIKIRSGWDKNSITFMEAAQAAVEAGAAGITLHPRTRSQGYTGASEWSLIQSLKLSVPVPVIGSGDLFSPASARRMLEETGCDGVMFARGALGNPFIFERTRALLETGEIPPPPTIGDIVSTIAHHLRLAVSLKGEPVACREMRKHICAYTKGIPGAAAIRRRATRASTLSEYELILEDMLHR